MNGERAGPFGGAAAAPRSAVEHGHPMQGARDDMVGRHFPGPSGMHPPFPGSGGGMYPGWVEQGGPGMPGGHGYPVLPPQQHPQHFYPPYAGGPGNAQPLPHMYYPVDMAAGQAVQWPSPMMAMPTMSAPPAAAAAAAVEHATSASPEDSERRSYSAEPARASAGLPPDRVLVTNPDTGTPILIKQVRTKQSQEHRDKLAKRKKIYACPYCDHIFSCSSNLIRHKRVHTGDKP